MPVAAETSTVSNQATESITVYHDPGCSCCHRWIEHLQQEGFEVKDIETQRLDKLKSQLGVPPQLASCHTATINGYVIEGHVPAADIKRLLTERPLISGLSVPGMPIGSPGMEMGTRRDTYSVIEFDKVGSNRVYRNYPAPQKSHP